MFQMRTVHFLLQVKVLLIITLTFTFSVNNTYTVDAAPESRESHESLENYHHHNLNRDDHDHRIAILIPFLSNSQPILPSYFPIFLRSVDGLSPLIDFFIFHNGQLSSLIHDEDDNKMRTGTGTATRGRRRRRTILDLPIPDNVKFIDLHNMTYFTSQFLQVMDVKRTRKSKGSKGLKKNGRKKDRDMNMSNREYDAIFTYYTRFLQSNPYVLIEFKPALGYLFQKYIANYTHWGYSDLDIYFGDVLSWITIDELTNFDIVTYGFGGDQQKAYLRGQFTFHKNEMELINMLWSDCDYLYNFDERFWRFLTKEEQYKLESAEGCYSSVAIKAGFEKRLRIKYAAKAWTNTVDDVDMAQFGVSAIFVNHIEERGSGEKGTVSSTRTITNTAKEKAKRSILIKKSDTATGAEYLHLMSMINSTSIVSSTNDIELPMQWEVGEMIPIHTQGEGARCMSWAPPQYQSNVCIRDIDNVTSHHTVFLINGKLYKQLYEERTNLFFLSPSSSRGYDNQQILSSESTENHVVIESRALFHIQEWKRNYRSSQLTSLKMVKDSLTGWTFYPEGVIPLFDSNQCDDLTGRNQNHLITRGGNDRSSSNSNDNDKRHFLLPPQYFCLLFKEKKRQHQYRDDCKWAVSWYDDVVYKLYGHDWGKNNSNDSIDVTLALTIRIRAFHDGYRREMNTIFDALQVNISNWNNQPFVLVICIVGSKSKGAFEEVYEQVNSIVSSMQCTNYLIGIVQKETDVNDDEEMAAGLISQKALINMAQSASLTRWTILGMDIEEKKMVLSEEASLFAQRAAISHQDQPGFIFVIPEFTIDNTSWLKFPPATSLSQLFQNITIEKCMRDHLLTSSQQVDNDSSVYYIQHQLHSLWWNTTKLETVSFAKDFAESKSYYPLLNEQINDIATRMSKVITRLNRLLLIDYIDELKNSPTFILMVDRYSPMGNNIFTSHVVPEIDELCGCLNMLRLSLFSMFNYRIKPLTGAFTWSSTMPPVHSHSGVKKCDKVLEEERLRMSKMMIIQGYRC